MLASYVLIDIDFDSPNLEFRPENDDEKSKIAIPNFSSSRPPKPIKGGEYGLFGRAFLAIEKGYSIIELMSHYRQATAALFAQRSIDSYNGFYLYIESQFLNGRTGTKASVTELSRTETFVAAVGSVIAEISKRKGRKPPFAGIESWRETREILISEIVELRGKLRHHSLNSPSRWNPDRQNEYHDQAEFLALVCNTLAWPSTTGQLFEKDVADEFVRRAKEARMTITLRVTITFKEDDRVHNRSIDISFPQPHANADVARGALINALEAFDRNSPAAELLAMRARVTETGEELFRYDLGPGIGR